MTPETAFLFDVDNTLLDNDRFERDLAETLDASVGPGSATTFRASFEARRDRLGIADYLGALQDCWEDSGRDHRWLGMGAFLLEYPFADRLFPDALAVLAACAARGPVWIVTDGDGIMQPRKLHRAGLWDAVGGKVRIYVHKETRLADIAAHAGARRYVMVDDKPRILAAMKTQWGARVTTVQPLQGHYAQAGASGADVTLARIGDLLAHPLLREAA